MVPPELLLLMQECNCGIPKVIFQSICVMVSTFCSLLLILSQGGDPRVVVRIPAFHVRVRGSFPGFGGLKETKLFLLYPLVKLSIEESLRDREVACSATHLQGLNFESCVWRAGSSHYPQEVLLPSLAYMCTNVA